MGKAIKKDEEILIISPNYRSLCPSIETFLDLSKLAPRLKDEQHVVKRHWEKLFEIIRQTNYQVIEKAPLIGSLPLYP